MDDGSLDNTFIPVTSVRSGDGVFVTKNIFCLPIQIVNLCFIGNPDEKHGWFLVDAGMPKSEDMIIETAESIYGKNNPPTAILLTHGHFDHIGAVVPLIKHWKVPVYAHPLEMPYLTGKKDYPEPDSSVEGGMVAKMSNLFPNEGIDLDHYVHPLPDNGTIQGLPGWQWIHTPGHTPGHVSFFHEQDRVLLAGDAFVTVKQEYLYKVITQEKEISGPPRYFTTDWNAAKQSVILLEKLKPSIAVTGHGVPVGGEELTIELEQLVREFDRVSKPDYGKFIEEETR
jgi:glyoxylase-like metal-dependent hydrolase (beta-lactamase superfamily II)